MDSNSYQKYLAVMLPFSITVSSLFLFGYWGSFNVNIFEYIGITDVIKISIYQLAACGIFFVIGSIIGNMVLAPKMAVIMPPGSGSDYPEAKYFRFFFKLMPLVIFCLIGYLILFTSSPDRWLKAGVLSMFIIPILIGDGDAFSHLIKSRPIRVTILNIMAILLALSYGWGVVDANKHKNSKSFVTINGKKTCKIYIGRTNTHVFLWQKKNQNIEIIQSSKIESLKYEVPPITELFDGNEKKSNNSN